MDVKLKPYKKNFFYSYAIGVYTTIELLTYRPNEVIKVLLHSRSKKSAGATKIRDLCQKHRIKIEINDGVIPKLAESDDCYAIGIFRKYSTFVAKNENHLVLVKPSDMGNLGTNTRTALGFGFKNLAIIKPGADIFHPKAVRASMGAIFQLNVEYFETFDLYKQKFTHAMYPFMLEANENLENVKFGSPASLIFGNEGEGLSKSFLNIGTPIKINQATTVDSLNLSVAVGIGLHKFFTNYDKI